MRRAQRAVAVEKYAKFDAEAKVVQSAINLLPPKTDPQGEKVERESMPVRNDGDCNNPFYDAQHPLLAGRTLF